MSEIIDIRYVLNPNEVASDSDKIDRAIQGTHKAFESSTEDLKENIRIQKQVLKELEQQYADTQKKVRQVAPGKARQELEAEMAAIRREIKAEKQALDDLTDAQAKNERSTRSLRTQIMELKNSMATMVDGSAEYKTAMLKLGELQDLYGDITQQGRVFADDEKYYRATTEAIQGISGAMSVGVGIASLFGASQENLAKIQARLQAVMAISIGVQQVAQVLNKDSYVSHLLLTKVKAAHATATGFLSKSLVAMGVSATTANVAAKALMITLTGGLILAVMAAVSAYSAWNAKQEEAAEKQRKLREETDKNNNEIANSIAPQLLLLTKLSDSWSKVGKSIAAQNKWIADNKEEIEKLGVSIKTVGDAENLFRDNGTVFIQSLFLRAKAAAAAALAVEKYKEAIKKELAFEARKEEKQPLGAESMPGYDKFKKGQVVVDLVLKSDIANSRAEADKLVEVEASYLKESEELLKKNKIKLGGSGKEFASGGTTPDTVAKAAKERQWAIEQARIDAMNEGGTKRLAQIDLNHQKEIARLREQQAEALKMANAIGDKQAAPQIKAEFATLEQASADKAMRDRLTVTKTMQEAILGELQKEVDASMELYGQELEAKWAYLEQYGTVEQQRYAITMQYGQKITEAKTEWQKKQLQQEESAALKEVDLKALQQSAPFSVLFDNLDTSATATINQAIQAARTLLDAAKESGKYTAQELKAMYDALGKAESEVRKRNPFAALGQAVEAWDKKQPQKSFSTLASAAGESLGLVGSSLGIVVGGLKEMGLAGDEQTQKILDDSVKLIGGFGDIATGLATMNPTQILQGAMSAFTALWSLFDEKGRQADRIIKESQEQIDTLKERYDTLGDAVEKAYSQDASQLIEDQNRLLEQQKQLIKNQIAAEQGKKDGGDDQKVKEWQNAIKEIDQTIADNAEKSVDAIFGADVQSAIDEFASAYVNAWGAGEDRAASQKDVVKKMIQGIVTELIKSNISDKVAALRTALKNAVLDGVISDTEQAAIDQLQAEIYAQSERDAKSYDKWLKGDEEVKNENSFTGAIRGTVATEASVAELGGIFRGQYDKLASIDQKVDLGFKEVATIARLSAEIANNTKRSADNTDGLSGRVDATNAKLDTLIKQTQKDTGSYGS